MINLNTLDLNLLRVFAALMRERSVSLAADRLNLTQPAVSNALNRLRSAFGDPLFVRTRSGMEPTMMAQHLAPPIQEGLATIRAGIGQSLRFDPSTSTRTFTIIMTDVGESVHLPPIVRELSRKAPSIRIRALELGREDYEGYLDSGAADLAIARMTLASTFMSDLLHESDYVAVLRADHPLLDRVDGEPRLTYDNYMAARHIAVIPRGASADPIDKALGSDARLRHVPVTLPHTTVLPSIMPGTDLIATVPAPCVDGLCAHGDLVWAPLPFAVEANKVKLFWHRRLDLDSGHIWLRNLIKHLEVVRIGV